MKIISLNVTNLNVTEILSREELKMVLGGVSGFTGSTLLGSKVGICEVKFLNGSGQAEVTFRGNCMLHR